MHLYSSWPHKLLSVTKHDELILLVSIKNNRNKSLKKKGQNIPQRSVQAALLCLKIWHVYSEQLVLPDEECLFLLSDAKLELVFCEH